MGFLSWFSGNKPAPQPPAPPPPAPPPPAPVKVAAPAPSAQPSLLERAKDPLHGDARLRPLVDQLRALKFDDTRAFFDATPDVDERTRAMYGLSESLAAPAIVQSWPREGQSTSLLTLRGLTCIELAWLARGRGWAKDLNAAQVGSFESWIDEARVDLEHAAQQAPNDAVPQIFLMAIEAAATRGTQLPAMFERARAAAPNSFYVHARRQWSLLWKWHGSHEQMFAFARAARDQAPAGSALPALVAWAICERWLAFLQSDELEGEDAQRAAAAEYIASPAVRAEFDDAWNRTFGAKDFRCSPAVAPAAAAAFAWNYSGLRENERAAIALRHTRGYADGWFRSAGEATLVRLLQKHQVSVE
ncbi:MAG: hypothetical protein U0228_08950 [Myxococcaceae bacterium]